MAGLSIIVVTCPPAAMAQASATAGSVIPLYPDGAVQALGVPEIRERQKKTGDVIIRNVSEPTLEIFRPEPGRGNGTAVIVAPGGGFVELDYTGGGTDIARTLSQHGVTAFVLKYRTIRSAPDPTRMPETHMREMDSIMMRAKTGVPVEAPRFAGERHAVEDGVRALTIIRHRAHEWDIDPARVGVLGFSAGGYLAADLAIGARATRPDFVVLLYGGLRAPVPAGAPPAFIAGAADDPYQPNDPVLLFKAWRRSGAAAELHVYERGGHGFDLRPEGATSDHWFDEMMWWMKSRDLVSVPAGTR